MTTISTHNGSSLSRQHNIRNPKIVSKEGHIKPGGQYEIWHDETLKEAYDRLFKKYINEYNANQRETRKIRNYLKHVEESSKHKPAYEMIVGVYGKETTMEQKKEILKEYVQNWEERNPSLKLVGAYYHADEEGQPHVHIDYVPFGTGYAKGLQARASLTKALENMGFVTKGGNTAQMQWQSSENSYLERLCKKRGFQVAHPQRHQENVKHKHTEIYKLEQEALKAQKQLEMLKEEVFLASTKKNALKSEIRGLNDKSMLTLKRLAKPYEAELENLGKVFSIEDEIRTAREHPESERKMRALYRSVHQEKKSPEEMLVQEYLPLIMEIEDRVGTVRAFDHELIAEAEFLVEAEAEKEKLLHNEHRSR